VASARLPIASAGAALVCAALAGAPLAALDLLAFDRQEILAGEFWRVWTGHAVHYSFKHALVNAGALLLLGAMCERALGSLRLAAVMLCACAAVSAGLLLALPGLAAYRGASGLAVMLGFLAGIVLWQARPRARGALLLCVLLWVLKTLLEAGGIAPDLAGLPEGVQVVWQAHVMGAACAWLAAHWLTRAPAAYSKRRFFHHG